MRFTLYSRSYCHLCEDMLNAMRAFEGGEHFLIDVIDVDADAALLKQYDELVPVLVGQKDGEESMQICHYFLDAKALRAFIDGTLST